MTDDRLNIPTDWKNALDLCVEGRGYRENELESPFDRFPARAKGVIRDEVWRLARQACGVSVRFKTDAVQLFGDIGFDGAPDSNNERVTPLRDLGLDCYGKADDGRWYWVGVRINRWDYPINRELLDGAFREYRVYLPLGLPVTSLKIGVSKGARFEKTVVDPRKPIVYYGTSIVHGAYVSRPGMAFTSIVSRRLDWPMVNLGFGGNGRLEPEVATHIRDIDAAVYVVDCLPNVDAQSATERLPVFIRLLRERRPDAPILLVGDRLFGDAAFIPARWVTQKTKSEAQRAVYMKLRADGNKNLYLLDARNFFGDDFEGALDGSHPTDLGSMRMADPVEPALRRLIQSLPL